MAINIEAVLAAVQAAEEEALNEVADYVARDAKARAPIRRVFRENPGFRRAFRALTRPERALVIRKAIGYHGYQGFLGRLKSAYPAPGGGNLKLLPAYRRYNRAQLRRPGSANSLTRSRQLRVLGVERGGRFSPRVAAIRHGAGFQSALLHPLLSARGRYEVASGRAIHREVLSNGNVRVQIGGRLKASIGNEGVVQSGDGAVARVSARVRYAKFVEFPTTHNAAQPFLLPALHDNRARLRSTLARELRSKLRG